LDVAQRYTSVEGGSDERVAEHVGSVPLGDPGSSGDPAHDTTGGVTADSLAGGGDGDGAGAALADSEVDCRRGPGGGGHGHDLAALADDGEGAVAAFESQVLDVSADGFGDPQPVEGPAR
jgi:hypothetical protein